MIVIFSTDLGAPLGAATSKTSALQMMMEIAKKFATEPGIEVRECHCSQRGDEDYYSVIVDRMENGEWTAPYGMAFKLYPDVPVDQF